MRPTPPEKESGGLALAAAAAKAGAAGDAATSFTDFVTCQILLAALLTACVMVLGRLRSSSILESLWHARSYSHLLTACVMVLFWLVSSSILESLDLLVSGDQPHAVLFEPVHALTDRLDAAGNAMTAKAFAIGSAASCWTPGSSRAASSVPWCRTTANDVLRR